MVDKSSRGKRNRQQAKDRVLQARIPEDLDEKLRDRSEQLGLSVSTIVRNVLLHTFELVEGVVSDSSQIAKVLTGWGAAPADPSTVATVIGWQEATLNRNGVCEQCNVILPAGQRAAIGVPTAARATLLCLECLAALSSSPDDPAKPPAPKRAKRVPAKKSSTGSKKSSR